MISFCLALCSALGACGLFYLTGLTDRWYWYWLPIPMACALYILLFALFLLFACLVSIFVDKAKPVLKPKKFFHWCSVWASRQLVWLSGARVKASGLEKLPDRRFLLVYNHLSAFDPLVILSVLKRRNIVCISKPENEEIPVCGEFMHESGFLTINREDPRKALPVINKAAQWIRDDIASVAIAPEGTRNRTSETLLPFKPGALSIARRADAPLVVVTLTGTNLITKNLPWKRTPVTMEICGVVSAEEAASLRPQELSAKVREIMLAHLPR